MICVFGVLKTKDGIKIRDEMLQWLEPLYDVLKIEQDPPGKLVEYPAIKFACQSAIEMNEPVLYLHTKVLLIQIPGYKFQLVMSGKKNLVIKKELKNFLK